MNKYWANTPATSTSERYCEPGAIGEQYEIQLFMLNTDVDINPLHIEAAWIGTSLRGSEIS